MTAEEEGTPRALDPKAILTVLERHGVRLVVIGGLACEARGVPLPRTEDLDITPDRDEANLNRLSAALTELNARIRAPGVPEGLPFSHTGRSLAAAKVWNLVTDHGPMDLAMVPDPEPIVARLKGAAERNRRSMEEEVRQLLEQRYPERLELRDRIRELWKRYPAPAAAQVDEWIETGRK